jgi:hypothetical protein
MTTPLAPKIGTITAGLQQLQLLAGVAPLWVGLATRFAVGAQQCLRPSTRITATTKHGLCYLDFISEFGVANIWQGYVSSRASRWCFAVSGADRFA